jgi:hypothetical protein
MKQNIKDKWISALRSGDYKQTFGRLRKDDCFCVMGVLCDVVYKENVLDISWKAVGGIYYIDNNDTMISQKISNFVGLSIRPVIINEYHIKRINSLTRMNDRYNYSFNELADIIEDQL